tara:strand:- start:337 stop:1206 length:870 start_codon:yes stop_codon:yes gene_type:complete
MRVLLILALYVGLIACRTSSDEKSIENIQIDLKTPISSHTSFYENGMTKLTGPGFEKFYRNKISSKNGVKLKEIPDLNSKSIATVPFDTEVYLKSNSTESTSDSVIDEKVLTLQQEKWVFVITEFYLNPGDYGYSEDQIEPTQLEGYLQSNSISKQLDSTKKSGIWKYFYISGLLEKEEYHHKGRLIKKINFDQDGDVVEIEEFRGIDDLLGGSFVKVSFHKNGNIKTIIDADGFGLVSISFDENGNEIENMYGPKETKSYLEKIKLSKDIREFFLPENKDIGLGLLHN